MKDLITKSDFWGPFPSLFKRDGFFSRFDKEIDKILNGKSDFEETDDKYIIEIEVPGVNKDEININLKNDILKVNWSRKKENKKGKGYYEMSEGSFSRSFDVTGADPDKIEAELKNGILKIQVYKKENFKAKKIEIK